MRDGAQVYLDRNGLDGDARRATEFLIRSVSEFVYGTDWARLSLERWSWANSESDYLGVGQGDFPSAGTARSIPAMAGGGGAPAPPRARDRALGAEACRARTTPTGVG